MVVIHAVIGFKPFHSFEIFRVVITLMLFSINEFKMNVNFRAFSKKNAGKSYAENYQINKL